MNRSLVEPSFLAKDLPEILGDSLRSGHSTCIRFNHRGDFLAAGRVDGPVVIFDCDTNSVARKLKGHIRQVQSLSWSADDRYLLSASQDWKAILWDLQTGEQLRQVKLEAPIFNAELHPSDHLQFVAALFGADPVLVDCHDLEPIIKTLPTASKLSQEDRVRQTKTQAAQNAKMLTIVTIWSPIGDYIFCSTDKGWLNVVDPNTCTTLYSTQLGTSSAIWALRFPPTYPRKLVVNSNDRTIRTFTVPDLTTTPPDSEGFQITLLNPYHDQINKLAWNCVCWNPNGEYVLASPKMNHSVYIWEDSGGSLMKILETPGEITNLDFHPNKPCLAAVGLEEGRIFIWSVKTPQSWAALAPDFVEVEESVEYVEKEDEFDIQPVEELNKRRLDLEDEDIDVLTIDPIKDLQGSSSFIMPVIIDAEASDSDDEVVAIGAGQFRRKTPGKSWKNGDKEVTPSGDEARKMANGHGRGAHGTKRKQRVD